MNERNKQSPECSYGTGSTHPVKSRGGILAVVLAVVILLGGIFSLMNVLNIRLFHKMKETAPAVTFSRQMDTPSQADRLGNKSPMLGIWCETVSPFLESYYHLPKGVYVTQVIPGGAAQNAGIAMGDVIISFAGTAVESTTELAERIRSRQVGETVDLTVIRQGKRCPIVLVLGEN